eukprot:03336_6
MQGLRISCPQSAICTGTEVLPDWDPLASIALITSKPSITRPNTTCFPSSQSVLTVQRKNWEPFVLGPALAIESMPGPSCLSLKFSSSNLVPIEFP